MPVFQTAFSGVESNHYKPHAAYDIQARKMKVEKSVLQDSNAAAKAGSNTKRRWFKRLGNLAVDTLKVVTTTVLAAVFVIVPYNKIFGQDNDKKNSFLPLNSYEVKAPKYASNSEQAKNAGVAVIPGGKNLPGDLASSGDPPSVASEKGSAPANLAFPFTPEIKGEKSFDVSFLGNDSVRVSNLEINGKYKNFNVRLTDALIKLGEAPGAIPVGPIIAFMFPDGVKAVCMRFEKGVIIFYPNIPLLSKQKDTFNSLDSSSNSISFSLHDGRPLSDVFVSKKGQVFLASDKKIGGVLSVNKVFDDSFQEIFKSKDDLLISDVHYADGQDINHVYLRSNKFVVKKEKFKFILSENADGSVNREVADD
jgi:hypothetical protein